MTSQTLDASDRPDSPDIDASFVLQKVQPALLGLALRVAYAVVVFELLAIAFIRYKFMKTPLLTTILQVIVGGAIVFAIGIWLGRLGAAGG